MSKVSIIYYSGTGNTEKMAELISSGVSQKESQVKLLQVSSATLDDIADSDIVVLGSPSMGNEVIEESEMEPFVESLKDIISGKKVALFGSYGWGDGEWMRNWQDRMSEYGAVLIGDGLIVNGYPEDEEENRCIEFGKSII
ncbi:flavodoxin [Clostridium manihotivorum]|uniref:Flavodoxin n=1 Tax=Clostridium manihotivorum TaxID=2320868 RepID=A0A410E1I0_9CLOT|nr:flavodoxin [Clostridium manihotivorum]QAA35151.1 flavodoxin [Clostridium manihotivorum]